MKSQTAENKYMPEIPAKESEEIRNSAQAMSLKIIADNIERMKKTSPNRPEAMKYFMIFRNFFGQNAKQEICAEKAKAKKLLVIFVYSRPLS